MSKHPYDQVEEFHKCFKHPVNGGFSKGSIELRAELIEEEFHELMDELIDNDNTPKMPIDKVKLTKELADLLYVAYGMAVAFGLPIKEVFDEVHLSNMKKVFPDGKPRYRDDGKVLKPKDWVEPNFSQYFRGNL